MKLVKLLAWLMERLQSLPRFSFSTKRIPIAARLVVGLAVMIVIATLLFSLPIVSSGPRLTINQAFFTATSALTVTGLVVITPSRDLTLIGQILLLVLIQTGGVGFMVSVVIVLRLIGRRISMLDRVALTDHLGLVMPGAVLSLTWRMLRLIFIAEGLGALALWLHWRELLGSGRAVFYAIFHSVSAFCNAGFDLFNGLAEFPLGVPNDNLSLAIMGSLIFMGGMGIPVLFELVNWKPGNRFSLHSRLTLSIIIILLCAGGFGIYAIESASGRLLHDLPPATGLLQSFFQSISARTAGFTGISRFENLAPASQLTLIVLMFIGSAPASMGGGITTGTFAALAIGLWSYVRGDSHPHIGGRSIAENTVRRAGGVLSISLFAIFISTWLILFTHDTTLDAALFEVVSAFATCGLSLALTPDLNPFGQAVIIVMMFWGRLGALTIVIALAQIRRPLLVEYPEEHILIG